MILKSIRRSRTWAGLATCLLFAPLAGVPYTAMAQAGAQTYAYVFNNADINQVVAEVFGNGLGVSYRIDPGVTGRMNFTIQQRLTKPQLLAAFEAALGQYDIVLIKEGDTYLIRPRADAQIGTRVTEAPAVSGGFGYQIRAVPIRYAAASEIAKALESLSRQKLVFFSSDNLGLILLGGNAQEIDSALQTITLFDQNSLSDARIRFFPVSSADAGAVASDLTLILTNAGINGVRLAPMKRLNGFFAFARTTDALDRIAEFVTQLDTPSQDSSLKVTVYQPRGSEVDALARTLNRVMGLADTGQSGGLATSGNRISSAALSGSATPDNAPTPETGSDAQDFSSSSRADEPRIIADRSANLLIIVGPEAMRVKAMNLLEQIDHEPTQVFIEASILEVTLNDEFSFGVDWQALKGAGIISNFTSDATNFPIAAPGLTIGYFKSDIRAAITALSSHSKVYVLSAPKITTRESVEAVLRIGDEVPIITQSSQSTSTSNAAIINSVAYKDTGVMLRVTPRVLAGNRIAMDVVQEVSTVQKTSTSGIDSPTFHQRNMQSSLIVPENTVVALGGLISTSQEDSQAGTPGLSKVPVLGNLFKHQKKSNLRTELVVLMQATVLRNDDSYARIWADISADMTELSGHGLLVVP